MKISSHGFRCLLHLLLSSSSLVGLLFPSGVLGTPLISDSDPALIESGQPWKTIDGQPIHAHGGGLLKHLDRYYWVGESAKGDRTRANVLCYSSPDLIQWQFERVLMSRESVNRDLTGLGDEKAGNVTIVERPKLLRNSKGMFVLLVHLDTQPYRYARVGFGTQSQDVPENPCAIDYVLKSAQRPAGLESRDIGIYTEGNDAYLLFASGHVNTDFTIAKMTPDYLSVEPQIMSSIHGGLEGPALIKTSWGEYYLYLSRTTGWKPNEGRIYSAWSLQGPWTERGIIAQPDSFNSQPTTSFQLGDDKWLYLGDRWSHPNLEVASYIWLPFEIDPQARTVSLKYRKSWSLSKFLTAQDFMVQV